MRKREQKLRLGLCCIFREQPIKFRGTTARSLSRLSRKDQLRKLSELCLHNAKSLLQAVEYCAGADIGGFRILSQIMPLRTHPDCGYQIKDLPGRAEILELLGKVKDYASKNDLRLTFHPDQFVVLNSPRPDVVDASINELLYQSEVAGMVGADVINIHAGGAYGDKSSSLKRFEKTFKKLPGHLKKLLTVENDDRIYSPEDVLALHESTGLPLVYDIHHHRCHPDNLSPEEASEKALATWNREPLFHISSPLDGWDGPGPEKHHDFININDFPEFWKNLKLTVEIEAKAKEIAILKLQKDLRKKGHI